MGQLLCNGEHAEAYGQRVTCHAKYIKSLLSRARSPTRHPSAAHTVFVLSPKPGQGGQSVSPLFKGRDFPVGYLSSLLLESVGRNEGNVEVIVRSERGE